MRAGDVAKLIAINLVGLLLLVFLLNLLASAWLDARTWLEPYVEKVDERALLPNYPDREAAIELFREFDALDTVYAPFAAWTREEFHGETTNVDAAGNRVVPGAPASPRGTVRFFGGSTMWGTGASDAGTIPAFFQRRFPEYRVTNQGESGFVSRQSLARLVNLVSVGKPMDLVVFYDGINDVNYLCQPGIALTGHAREARMRSLVSPSSHLATALFGSLREVLAGLARKWRAVVGLPRCEDDPAYADRVADVLVENWRIGRAVAGVGGARFLAILQPVAWVGAARIDHLGLPQGGRAGKAFADVYERIRQRMRAAHEPWMLDFTDAFDGDELIYIDVGHVTAEGNAIIARRLAGVAAPLLP